VADVSHYLREGTALDHEAQARGVSVYLPNRAIPMLPEALSGHLCSLVPGEDRLAMVVRIDYDRGLAITEVDFCAAVIHSHGRLDYPGVAAALAGDVRGKRKHYEPFLPSLRAMDALARKLRVRRQERGALDLDLPQVVVELDRDDPALVRDVRRARRDPGERHAYAMIEEFMLAANEAVGDSFRDRNEDTAWRVHEVPDEEKVAAFAVVAERYGIKFDPAEAVTPLGLAAVLKRLRGHPAEKPLSFLLLRALKQATYDVVNVGHFGLASPAYLHFTSPIRRYPDVIVHRLLKHRLASLGKPAGGFPPMAATDMPASEILQRASTHASFCERKAMEVEREVVDLYRAFFMRERVGDVLEGAITGVTSFGVFVVMDEPFVEGLVRTDYLAPDDFYDFDEIACRLIGRRSGKTFSLGDRVKVEVLQVSVARRRIELRLDGARAPGPRGKRHEGKRDKTKPGRQERRQKIRGENRRRSKA
jgi:ribonuclease R